MASIEEITFAISQTKGFSLDFSYFYLFDWDTRARLFFQAYEKFTEEEKLRIISLGLLDSKSYQRLIKEDLVFTTWEELTSAIIIDSIEKLDNLGRDFYDLLNEFNNRISGKKTVYDCIKSLENITFRLTQVYRVFNNKKNRTINDKWPEYHSQIQLLASKCLENLDRDFVLESELLETKQVEDVSLVKELNKLSIEERDEIIETEILSNDLSKEIWTDFVTIARLVVPQTYLMIHGDHSKIKEFKISSIGFRDRKLA